MVSYLKLSLVIGILASLLMVISGPMVVVMQIAAKVFVLMQPTEDPSGAGRSRELRGFNALLGAVPIPIVEDLEWMRANAMEAFPSVVPARTDITRQDILVDNAGAGVQVPVSVAIPPDAAEGKAVIWLHGGGMAIGSAFYEFGCSDEFAVQSRATLYSVDYRLMPNVTAEEAISDCVAVYEHLLKAYKPEQIIIGGCSGGGMATLLTGLQLAHLGLPSPAGMIVQSPGMGLEVLLPDPLSVFDLPSWRRDIEHNTDVMIERNWMTEELLLPMWIEPQNKEYVLARLEQQGGRLAKTLIQAGADEAFASIDQIAFEYLQKKGADVEWWLTPNVGHCYHMYFKLNQESGNLFNEIVQWAEAAWGKKETA